MNYILTMSLSGSCLYIMYRLVRLCAGNRLREGWYYSFLKTVMLYFMIPLPWLKKVYVWLINFSRTIGGYATRGNIAHSDWIVFSGKNGWRFNGAAKLQANMLGIWVAGTIIVGCVLLVYYLKRRKKLLNLCVNSEGETEGGLIEDLVNEVKVRTPVQFKGLCVKSTAFTIGFFKPVVFYSKSGLTEEKEMLLKHELMHIKRKDMFWQFLSFIVVIMHWYNPFAWLCKQELGNSCESSCDEQVLRDQAESVRVNYVNLLLKYMTDQKGEIFEVNLSKNAKEVEKRMKSILSRTKKLPNIVGGMLAIILVVLNSVTVFAYEDINVYQGDMEIEDVYLQADIAFVPSGEELTWVISDYVTEYVMGYENQFVDKEGNVYEVLEGVEVYKFCEHEYVEGTQQLHVRQDNGGCKIYFYDAKRCSKCGYLTDVVHIATLEYVVCTH